MIKIVFAVGSGLEFGNNNGLPWPHNSVDLQNFKRETTNCCLVMGEGTFKSLPKKLPGRCHVVLASVGSDPRTKDGTRADVVTGGDIEHVLAESQNTFETLAVIGGPSVISQAVPFADEIVMTVVDGNYPADTMFPADTLAEIHNKFTTVDTTVYNDAGLTVYHFKRT